MAEIVLETLIDSPLERVFDLSRSIDFHCRSTGNTQEQAVAGVTSGLISAGETVTWRARHFGVWQRLTVRITHCERPFYFRDEQVKGAFKFMNHEHRFKEVEPERTLMIDVFMFQSPLGFLGRIVDVLVLERYMRSFLVERNRCLKQACESDEWKMYLSVGIPE